MGTGRERRPGRKAERKFAGRMVSTGDWNRLGKFDQHHDLNRSRGGTRVPANMLKLDIARHRAWHFLFGNKTFVEVAELLLEVNNRQQRRRGGDQNFGHKPRRLTAGSKKARRRARKRARRRLEHRSEYETT